VRLNLRFLWTGIKAVVAYSTALSFASGSMADKPAKWISGCKALPRISELRVTMTSWSLVDMSIPVEKVASVPVEKVAVAM
jgi:hypothetical protein